MSGPNVTVLFDDAAFLRTPALWPHGAVCPVVRADPGDGFVRGLVFAMRPTEVVGLNLFNHWTVADYHAARRHGYTSIDELVADGWRVD